MQVSHSTFTIAEYCKQMKSGDIIVNYEYQRSPLVWPSPAKSFLIDTILLGFPIPKLSLYQKTDLRSRQTIKEIVDGQQRSQAILDFFDDKLRIVVPGETASYSGKKFSELEEADQLKFLQYQLSVDVFVGATDVEIRQVFRRINAYTIPLNDPEKRHATYQGEFKWFIANLTDKYSQSLKNIGAVSERQIIRMVDADLFTEIIHALYYGIVTKSEPKLDKFYALYDLSFPDKDEILQKIDTAFSWLFSWREIHQTPLTKPHNIYIIILAVIHALHPVEALLADYEFKKPIKLERETVLINLAVLASALSSDLDADTNSRFRDFIEASTRGATDTKKYRQIRFKWICKALEFERI